IRDNFPVEQAISSKVQMAKSCIVTTRILECLRYMLRFDIRDIAFVTKHIRNFPWIVTVESSYDIKRIAIYWFKLYISNDVRRINRSSDFAKLIVCSLCFLI